MSGSPHVPSPEDDFLSIEYEFEGERLRTLPDLLGPGVRVLFVGYNPSLRAARLGRYYAGRNNRFWDLLAASGLTPRRLTYEEGHLLPGLGIGITDLVKRPTRSAADVTAAEFRAGALRVRRLVAEVRPKVVAYNGKGVYLLAAGVKNAPWGLQPTSLVPGLADYVVPSPSGLATIPFAEKARWYTGLREVVEGIHTVEGEDGGAG
ncbi:MAG TPA: mismatch-specific DNA-glycosylase [Longimicrobium sp.]|nr:mismatch-specific DNA-glycosylase [Longimicrobium sp.]